MKTNRAGTKLGGEFTGHFEVLKQRLLHQKLNQTPELETHALIIREAEEAAMLAWFTSYPFLTFPCLFEERAAAVLEQARREAQRYWSHMPSGNKTDNAFAAHAKPQTRIKVFAPIETSVRIL